MVLNDEHRVRFLRGFGATENGIQIQIFAFPLFSGMNNESDVAIRSGREAAEAGDQQILNPVTVEAASLFRSTQHKLDRVDNDMSDVVHISGMFNDLEK